MEDFYRLPRMAQIRCIDAHKCQGIMEYRDYGFGHLKNGYHCPICGAEDLDASYVDMEQRESWQKDRICINKDGGM